MKKLLLLSILFAGCSQAPTIDPKAEADKQWKKTMDSLYRIKDSIQLDRDNFNDSLMNADIDNIIKSYK
jgi:PBP1b-binding outer membrane lipoprotein LpoB